MLHGGVMIYTGDDYEYEYTIPMIYTNNEWKEASAYVYMNGLWELMGEAGCPMVYWYDSDGKLMMDNNGKYLLVRDMKDWYYLYTSDTGAKVKDNTTRYIRVPRWKGL